MMWFVLTGDALAGPSKTVVIDDLCRAIRKEFVEADPRYFAGPDPWVQLDQQPDSFADPAVATVYQEGTRIRWVVLEMQGPDDTWFEITSYFFDEDGLLRKRERRLDEYSSHIQVNDDRYFMNGKAIKENYRHAALTDKENWEIFSDPEAPIYSSTAELPEIFFSGALDRLAVVTAKILPSLLWSRR
jgi:hypothetical protein